ncbi:MULTISPECIES: aldo/keto reductase [Brevibacterium]|uniref:Aldo/keto reductase n=1 Tax=Brevibacterium salitolerans TaxID=1403566 RepID=A0ABN2XBB2_9MICO|nr:aldo/keto reductase [Brevibacterium sp.]
MTQTAALSLPPIGFGTYRLRGLDGARAVAQAVESGYRLLDSAFNYENEAAVAEGVRQSGIGREEILFTSKLAGRHHSRPLADEAIQESVLRTGLGHIDLMLIHWPNPRQGLFVEAWQALVDAREAGLVRHIGVSNFLPAHLEQIEEATGVAAEVNQIELHPRFPQEEQLAYHRERGIVTQAWSPIGRPGAGPDSVLDDPVVLDVAAAHGISATQAVLAWHAARGVVPLPKSQNAERQRENLAAAEVSLTADEVASLTALGRADGRLKDQDPAVYEEF